MECILETLTADNSALNEVQTILNRFVAIREKATPMYQKNISLAILDTAFQASATAAPSTDSKGMTPRVIQLGLYLDQYFDKLSAFDDVKNYVARLGFEEAKAFVQDLLPKLLEEVCDREVTADDETS